MSSAHRLRLLVDDEEAGGLLLALSSVAGITATFAGAKEADRPPEVYPTRGHPPYSLDPVQVTEFTVALAGGLTGLSALVVRVVGYLGGRGTKESLPPPVAIVIGGKRVELLASSDPEELTERLRSLAAGDAQPRIFLSYGSDAHPLARELALELHGRFEVLLDRDRLARAGSYNEELHRQATAADLMVFLASPRAVTALRPQGNVVAHAASEVRRLADRLSP